MAQMSAIDADSLSIGQNANIFPDDFFVAERGPAVRLTLFDKGFQAASNRCFEKGLTSDRVIVNLWLISCRVPRLARDLIQPGDLVTESISTEFSIVAIEAANVVSILDVAAISEILLDGLGASSMGFLRHEFFGA